MQHRYGVSLVECIAHGSSKAYLIAQGPDVNTSGRNHPYLRNVLSTFSRSKKVTINDALVKISSSPQSPTILSQHRQRQACFFPPFSNLPPPPAPVQPNPHEPSILADLPPRAC